MKDKAPIIVFDTDCVLCSGMVKFVLNRESSPVIRFAGAWSPEGLELAAKRGFTREDLNRTFLLIDDQRALTRSDASLEILTYLRFPWPVLRIAKYLPRLVRDSIYNVVAQRRYRWFGRKENCVFVPPDQRDRFIGVS